MQYGRYQIVEEIGKGSMGVVYKAYDPNLDLNVALKVMRHDRVASDPFVRRFLAEARALGRLDHPNIVRVYNVDEDEGTVYIAMEFIEGESLSDYAQKNRPDLDTVIEIGVAVSDALDYAHKNGIVHRDIKPGNILVRSDGRVKLTDFGIAHIEDPSAAEQTQAGEILGTPAYMSPEQVIGKPVDGRSDLFSLGIVLYELSTGARPFNGDTIAAIFSAISQKVPDLSGAVHSLPPGLTAVIMKCLEKEPDKRYATGYDLAAALKNCLQPEQVEERPPVAEAPKSRSGLMAVLLVMVLALSVAAYFLISGRKTVNSAEVKSGGAVQEVGKGFLSIESMPPGAQVFIDGTLRGSAPLKTELAAGKHEVKLTLADFYDWEAQIQLADKEESPLSVRLVPFDKQK